MITVIATVLNEGESLRRLLDSLCAQTRQPDEVIITDGGSRDQTVAILHEYEDRLPLRVLVEPGANISAGRNRAIAAASGDDHRRHRRGRHAGARLAGAASRSRCSTIRRWKWSAASSMPTRTAFSRRRSARRRCRWRTRSTRQTFLPSSRSVAFRKTAWITAGGYPEWLDYCEDLIFDLRLREIAAPTVFQPGALVYFRPRRSLSAFFKQYYLYARGDGKADLWRKRHAIRYATYLIAAAADSAARSARA